jgi:hypothetical protein
VWDVRLFGAYDQPNDLFKTGLQEDLKTAYEARTGVEPLDFSIGYKWRQNESNLLLAVRKASSCALRGPSISPAR